MKSYGRQTISEQDIDSVVSVLRGEMLTQGPLIEKTETELAEKVGANYCTLVNSATAALHLALIALGVDEKSTIWTVSNTFLATANAARYCRASLKFCDISSQTLNIDMSILAQSLKIEKIRNNLPDVIIVVHFAGSSCDMTTLYNLSKEYNFKIIEDASHAIGGKYLGKYIGDCTFSEACIFSFHPVKIITSGEGGAVTTNKKGIARIISSLRSHGTDKKLAKFSWEYQQQLLGYNYRMPDINAALLRSQLKNLDIFVHKRNEKASFYKKSLADTNIQYQKIPDQNYSAYHLFTIKLPISSLNEKEKFKSYLANNGIGSQVHYIPVHSQPYYKNLNMDPDLPNTERNYIKTLSIPLYPSLTTTDQAYVIEKIKGYKFG